VEQPSVKINGVKVFVDFDPSRTKQNSLRLVPADYDAAIESVATTTAPGPDSSKPTNTLLVAIVILMVGLLCLGVGCGIIFSRRHRNHGGGDNADAWARKSPHVVQNQAYVHPDTRLQQPPGIQNDQDNTDDGSLAADDRYEAPVAGQAQVYDDNKAYEAPVAGQMQVYDDNKAYEAPVAGQMQVYDDHKMDNEAAGSRAVGGVYAAFNNGNALDDLVDDATYGGIIGDFADDSTTDKDETSETSVMEPKVFVASSKGPLRKASVYTGFDVQELNC